MGDIRKRLYYIIFHDDTPVSKGFDLVLIFIIVLSVFAVIFESIPAFRAQHRDLLHTTEWVITIIFTMEYMARIWTHDRPYHYILSFFGIIDFLAIIPIYLDLIFTGAMGFAVIRALRLLRIFRILKITRYSREGVVILEALKASRYKIFVFLFGVLMVVVIIGTLMYLIEGEENGFTSIPSGIYWAIVTLTTVGYGDLTPATSLGKFISSFVMVVGYGVIAVPTGIVTYEIASSVRAMREKRECQSCGHHNHDSDAIYCKYCGEEL